MEHKTLYCNTDATLSALEVLPVQRAVSVSSTVLQTSFTTGVVRLNPGEELRSFLYVGMTDGTILLLRCTMRLPAGNGRAEHLVSVELGARAQLLPPSPSPPLPSPLSACALAGSAATAIAGGGLPLSPAVTFLSTSGRLPLLFALTGGALSCLRATDLQPISAEYFQRLRLPAATTAATAIVHCCVAHDQELSQAAAAVPSGVIFLRANAWVRLALAARQVVHLVECTRHGAFPILAGSGDGGSALFIPEAVGSVQALGWQADTVIIGTPTAYLSFSVLTGQLLHRMNLALSPGQPFVPTVRFIAGGLSLDGAGAWQEDWELLTALAIDRQQEKEPEQPPRQRPGAVQDRDDETLDGMREEWRPSLLIRTPDGALHAVDCVASPNPILAEAPLFPVASDSTAAAAVDDAVAVSPFLVIRRRVTGSKGSLVQSAFALHSCCDAARVWATVARTGRDTNHCSRRADNDVSADSVVTVQGDLQGLIPCPMGVLVRGTHSVEALVLKPASAQIDALVAAGQYATAVAYLVAGAEDLALAVCTPAANDGSGARVNAEEEDSGGSDNERGCSGGGMDADDGVLGSRLRGLYRSCAAHALASARYAEAFELFVRADIPVRTLLRYFPEFRLPPTASALATVAATPLTLSYPDSETPYRVLYDMLTDHFSVSGGPTSVSHTEASPPDGHDGDGEDETFVTAIQEATAVEFALFLLYTLDHGALGTTAARLDFFARAQHLPLRLCLSYIDAGEGLGESSQPQQQLPPYPRPDLVPLLLAGGGCAPEALARCRKLRDVSAAAIVLRIAPATPSFALYEEHMPWMLRTNTPAAMTALLDHAAVAVAPAPATRCPPPPPELVVPILVGQGGGEALYTYLAFQIYACGCADRHLHTLHATNLIDMVRLLREAGGGLCNSTTATSTANTPTMRAISNAASATVSVPAGGEAGLLGKVRRALLQFMTDDAVADYDADLVLIRLRAAALHEERVVVLHRVGDDAAALRVLVYDMNDTAAAVRYCMRRPLRWQRGEGVGLTGAAAAVVEGETACSASPVSPAVRARSSVRPEREAAVATAAAAADFGGAGGGNGGGGGFLALPSHACLSALAADALVRRHHDSDGGSGESAKSPAKASSYRAAEGSPDVPGQAIGARFNRCLHLLLELLLAPPLGEVPRTEAALRLLNTHAHLMDPGEVLASLPGDVPLSLLASYLTRSFQTVEHNVTLAQAEAAAAMSVAAEVELHHAQLRQRCVCVDGRRRCAGCQQPMREKEPLAVFPNLKVTHFRCHRDGHLDPERGVPFRAILR